MFYLIIAIVIGAVVFAVGYAFGKTRKSEYDKIQKEDYGKMVKDLTDARRTLYALTNERDQYESALNNIAAGRGGVAEIQAASAIAAVKYSRYN